MSRDRGRGLLRTDWASRLGHGGACQHWRVPVHQRGGSSAEAHPASGKTVMRAAARDWGLGPSGLRSSQPSATRAAASQAFFALYRRRRVALFVLAASRRSPGSGASAGLGSVGGCARRGAGNCARGPPRSARRPCERRRLRRPGRRVPLRAPVRHGQSGQTSRPRPDLPRLRHHVYYHVCRGAPRRRRACGGIAGGGRLQRLGANLLPGLGTGEGHRRRPRALEGRLFSGVLVHRRESARGPTTGVVRQRSTAGS